MNSSEKFLVCLYSDPNFLSLNILENLIANNCYVNIFTRDINGWESRTVNIAARNRFNIAGTKAFSNSINYNYKILCSGFLKKEKISESLDGFLASVDLSIGKTFIILPKEVSQTIKTNLIDSFSNVGVIYVADLLGPRIDLQSDLKMSEYLREAIGRRSLTMPVGEVLYPIFVNDASRQIVKWLFGFGPFGREVCLLGQEISTSMFWQANTELLGEIKMQSVVKNDLDKLPANAETYRLPKDLGFLLSETYKWISLNNLQNINTPKAEKTIRKNPPLKRNKANKNYKRMRYLLLFTITVLLFPLFLALLSGGLLYVAYSQMEKGNKQIAQKILYLSRDSANIGYHESRILKYVPIIGYTYKEFEYTNHLLVNVSKIGIEGIPILESGLELLNNALGDDPYSVTSVISGSDNGLRNIYKYLTVIEEKTIESVSGGSLTSKYVSAKINFGYFKTLTLQVSEILFELPDALGVDISKTYFVLFENNMELRPTGGFIGSYGLLTFDKGRLTDFTISDVYTADGQLNGHVEPPRPIKEYLGEANWWLRDSNWDPDFPTSAKRAEWFLDKEMDKKVDGVIAIDLGPIKAFLELNGPIYLSDYNATITENNFYEKVQSEVEENFFPGTHKKASFLTALAKSILEEVNKLTAQKGLGLLKVVYTNLEQKHVQIFLHDAEFQNAIKVLGWDGSVYVPKCGENCYSDLVGIAEANVGVNKSNYFIKRSQKLDINIDRNRVNKVLSLTLSNSANSSLGLAGRYKSYIRLLVPEDSTEVSIVSSIGQNTQSLIPEVTNSKGRKEIGTIIEVLPGETKNITFYWSAELDRPIEQYGLLVRKQAGVDGHPLFINIDAYTHMLNSNPMFSLTEQGNYVYNTTLAKDFFARFSF